jgi:hypothetical protein
MRIRGAQSGVDSCRRCRFDVIVLLDMLHAPFNVLSHFASKLSLEHDGLSIIVNSFQNYRSLQINRFSSHYFECLHSEGEHETPTVQITNLLKN